MVIQNIRTPNSIQRTYGQKGHDRERQWQYICEGVGVNPGQPAKEDGSWVMDSMGARSGQRLSESVVV